MDDRTAQERIAQLERRVAELEAELAQVRVESQQKLCHLQMVLDLMVQVNASLDLHRVLTAIMHAAERLTDAETSSLLLYDPETDELFFEVATGEKGEAVKQMRLKRGQGIAGHVLETGQPMLVADVTSDARHAKIVDETTGFVTRNLIAVPPAHRRRNQRCAGSFELPKQHFHRSGCQRINGDFLAMCRRHRQSPNSPSAAGVVLGFGAGDRRHVGRPQPLHAWALGARDGVRRCHRP
jgi:putative methionine-R-sulfoxide reductase with GAF domain